MSMNTSGGRSRSRRSERTQQLYEARSLPVDMPDERRRQPERNAMKADAGFTEAWAGAHGPSTPADDDLYADAYSDPDDAPGEWNGESGQYDENEPSSPDEPVSAYVPAAAYSDADYPPNEWEDEPDQRVPNDEPAPYDAHDRFDQSDLYAEPDPYDRPAQPDRVPPSSLPVSVQPPAESDGPDLSAYYRRPTGETSVAADGAEQPSEAQFAYAPPLKLGYTSLYAQDQPWQAEDAPGESEDGSSPRNVYHPRDAAWAMTDKSLPVDMSGGYQVEEEGEAPVIRRRRKRRIRRTVVLLCVIALLGGVGYAFRDPLTATFRRLMGQSAEPTLPVAAITTSAPVKAYDAASPTGITSKTGDAISRLSGSMEMEPYVVTDTSILTRNPRPDGTYDFYLFSADQGRLLAYYEGLGAKDVYPLPGGGYYLRQPPYLIKADGSALLKTDDAERMLGETSVLEPMMNGWAIIRNAGGTLCNYINAEGQLLNRLWFAKVWPMTGRYTVAYVDTGNLGDLEGRYTLYVADGEAGTAVKWMEAGAMDGVVASACGAAYLDTGELYRLEDISVPLLKTDQVSFYVDCDAMVIRNAETGKYGLYVHGAQHYDFSYDRIEPVPSDIQWKTQRASGAGGEATLAWVTDASYPQPLSHYFLLERDGAEEYVALSTLSACPVILD